MYHNMLWVFGCVMCLHGFSFLFCPDLLLHSDWWWRLLQMHVTWGEELQILLRNAKMTATFLCSFQKRIKGKEWLDTRLKSSVDVFLGWASLIKVVVDWSVCFCTVFIAWLTIIDTWQIIGIALSIWTFPFPLLLLTQRQAQAMIVCIDVFLVLNQVDAR